MGRIVVHLALMARSALVLAGCGLADSHAVLPEFLRTRAIEQPPPEPPPDVRQLIRKNLESVFVAASNPQKVRVSPPLHEAGGPGWTPCVTPKLSSLMRLPFSSSPY